MGPLQRIIKCELQKYARRNSRHIQSLRYMSSYKTERLEFAETGNPSEVIQHVVEEKSFELKAGEVLVKFLACPVNPADINTIQGIYGIKPNLPAIGGGEGVAEVLESNGGALSPGDWVLPARSMSGTWISHYVFPESNLIPIRKDIPVEGAATLKVNPATALRMLEDFVPLQEGDVVVQNGANSGVGLAAIQIAKKKKLQTINIVRDRDDIDDLKAQLKSLGATYVLTEEEAKKAWKELPRPRLALNCVGGTSSTELCKALADKGVHVTYGGMSWKPVMVGTAHLIFKDINIRGFWMSRWYQEQGMSQARQDMFNYLTEMMYTGELTVPSLIPVPFDQYKEALDATLKGYKKGKFIFKNDK